MPHERAAPRPDLRVAADDMALLFQVVLEPGGAGSRRRGAATARRTTFRGPESAFRAARNEPAAAATGTAASAAIAAVDARS